MPLFNYNPEETFLNFDKQLNKVGIFSLSETDVNQLLWAHYADSFRGLAIGFEATPDSKLASNEYCIKVNYSDERPTFKGGGFINETSFYGDGMNIQKISFKDPTFRQAVSTKKTIWAYEKEWRYIEEYAGSYNYPSRLREIIFGLRCPMEIRRRYISLVKDNFIEPIAFYEIVERANSSEIAKI